MGDLCIDGFLTKAGEVWAMVWMAKTEGGIR